MGSVHHPQFPGASGNDDLLREANYWRGPRGSQDSIASRPRLSAAMVVAPRGTGAARKVEAANVGRNAVRPRRSTEIGGLSKQGSNPFSRF